MAENITVTGAFGEKPVLEFTGAPAPEKMVLEVLSEGDGPELEEGMEIVVDYLGQIWNGRVFDNSFDRGMPLPFKVGVGMVIRGWDVGLVQQKVGSRVLMIIPPEHAYGNLGVPQAGIAPNDHLVFVTDILGIRTWETSAN